MFCILCHFTLFPKHSSGKLALKDTCKKKNETTNVQYMKSIYFPKHYKVEFSCMLLVRDTKMKSNANAEELIEGLTVIKKCFACSMSLHQARKHIMTMT